MTMTPAQRVEILRACCCIAGADGEATEDERAHLFRMADTLGVGDASLNAMIDRAERDPEFYKQQFNILKDDPQECLQILLQILTANGAVKESELQVLQGLATKLEISDTDLQTRLQDLTGPTPGNSQGSFRPGMRGLDERGRSGRD